AEAAIYVYRYLLGQIDSISAKIAKGKGKTGRNSAKLGIISGLRKRMSRDDAAALNVGDLENAESAEKTVSMVLLEATEESERFLADAYGNKPFRKSSGSNISIDHDAYRAGVDAASDIDIPDPNNQRSALGRGKVLTSGK